MPTNARPNARHAGRWWGHLLLGSLVALLTLLGSGHPAAAQDDGGPATVIRGTFKAPDDSGVQQPVEGITVIVTDADGNEVGTAVSDADGNWAIEVPGAGTYTTTLDVASLPEGVSVREGQPTERSNEVRAGAVQGVLFPLGERVDKVDNTIVWVQLLVDGLKLGLLIAMCAIGLSLIYGTTGLVNFAHGELVTLGGFAALAVHVKWMRLPLIVAAVIAVLVAGLAGGVFNRFVWKPLRDRGASLIAQLVVSIGFSILLRYVLLYIFDGRSNFYRDFHLQSKINMRWFTIAPKDLFIILFSTAVLVMIGMALHGTRIGKAMRAVADNRDLAESSGIDVERVIKYVWVLGAGLAGLGGVLFGLTESIGWETGFRILLLMFAGVTLGGLGTAYGALFGSIIVGIFIQLSTLVIPSDMKNVGALLMLVVILLVRPQGLLGRAERIG